MNSIFPKLTVPEERLRSDITHLEKQLRDAKKQSGRQKLQKTLDDRINELGWLLCARHRFEEGLSAFLLLSLETHSESKFAGLSMALMETGRFEEAHGILQEGLAQFPDSWMLLNNAGNFYHAKKDYNNSLRYFERALNAHPCVNQAGIMINKGNALYGLGLYEESLEIFRSLLSNNQESLHSLVMCGYCYLNTGYPEEAIAFFKKALLSSEADENCYNGLYWSYLELGMLEDAVNIVRLGLSKFPAASSDLYIDLGDGYYRKGWIEESKDIVEEGLKLFPDDEELKEMLHTLNDEINNPDAGNKPPTEGCILVLMKKGKKIGKRK